MGKELTTTVRLMGVLDPSLQRTFNTVKKELKGLQQSKDIQNFGDRWQAMGKHVSKIGTQITNVGTSMTKKLTVPIVAGMTVATKAGCPRVSGGDPRTSPAICTQWRLSPRERG